MVAALLGGLSVVLGAFGAHALKGGLSPRMGAAYNTAVEYQMAHALALLFIASRIEVWRPDSLIIWSGRLITAGVVLFSGSLYLMALFSSTQLGMITPIGGILLISGWTLLGVAAYRSNRDGAVT